MDPLATGKIQLLHKSPHPVTPHPLTPHFRLLSDQNMT